MKKSTILWLLAILTLAAGLRLYRLDFQSLWVDEIASMIGADPDQSWSDVISYSVTDQPPAFFLLLHAWFKVFSFTGFNGRLLSVLIGIAGAIAMFCLGKEVKNDRVGLISSLLTSVSFLHILFSQEARFYTLMFFSSAMSFLFFIRAVKRVRLPDFFLYTCFTILLLYTHYFGLVVLASQGILFLLLIFTQTFNKRFLILSVAAAVIIILTIIPWLPIFFSDAQTQTFWIQMEPIYFPLQYFYVYFKDVLSCLVYGIALMLYGLSVYKLYQVHRKIDPVDAILVGSVFFSFAIPLAYSIIQTPLLQVRYTLIALPSLIIMISLGINLFPGRFQNILLVATCCTSLLSIGLIEQFYTKMRKEDWRGMTQLVMREANPGQTFVSPKAWYCNFYFKSMHSSIRVLLPDQAKILSPSPREVWWLDAFDITPGTSPTENDLLKEGFVLVKSDSLYRARVSHYQLPD